MAALLYLDSGSVAVKVVAMAMAMAMALETQAVLGGTTHADWV